jgi:tetratricopeptide (TPR) repeat protein
MRTVWTVLAATMLVGAATMAGAQTQERLSDQLRKGIVQEETGQNIDKAIQAYQAVVARFDEDRKTAATALFRLAECYRKAGKREQAVAAYQRVVREFADQATLVESSRRQLIGTFGLPEPRTTSNSAESAQLRLELAAAQKALENTRQSEANARKALENARLREVTPEALVSAEGAPTTPEAAKLDIQLLEMQMVEMQSKVEVGLMAPADLRALQLRFEAARQRYEQAMKQRQAEQMNDQKTRLLAEAMLKSIQDEMTLVQNSIHELEKKYTPEHPDLLQLRRDLIALQRKAEEIKIQMGTPPKR